MQVLCSEGVATRTGPEPCVVSREGQGEASAGDQVLSAFEPAPKPVSNMLWSGRRASHSSSFQDTERDRCSAHIVEAPCGGRNVLAHVGPAAQKVTEFVVATAISLG